MLRLLARAGTALARDGMDMGICVSVGGVAYRARHFGTTIHRGLDIGSCPWHRGDASKTNILP